NNVDPKMNQRGSQNGQRGSQNVVAGFSPRLALPTPMQRRDSTTPIAVSRIFETYLLHQFHQLDLGGKLPHRIRKILVCRPITGDCRAKPGQDIPEVKVEDVTENRNNRLRKLQDNGRATRLQDSTHFL